MSISEQQRKFMQLVGLLINWAITHGYELAGGELKRSAEQQVLHIKSGATRTKHSFHQDCLAIDLSLFRDNIYLSYTQDYLPLGEYWESLHPDCVWGGRFGDRPDTAEVEGWDGNHFQFGGKDVVIYYQKKHG